MSRELYKGVLRESTGVYNGMVKVQQVAQKTDSEQANHNLLLSDTADINFKPEIYADDVKCAARPTVGQSMQRPCCTCACEHSKSGAVHMLTQASRMNYLANWKMSPASWRTVTDRLVQLKDGHR